MKQCTESSLRNDGSFTTCRFRVLHQCAHTLLNVTRHEHSTLTATVCVLMCQLPVRMYVTSSTIQPASVAVLIVLLAPLLKCSTRRRVRAGVQGIPRAPCSSYWTNRHVNVSVRTSRISVVWQTMSLTLRHVNVDALLTLVRGVSLLDVSTLRRVSVCVHSSPVDQTRSMTRPYVAAGVTMSRVAQLSSSTPPHVSVIV